MRRRTRSTAFEIDMRDCRREVSLHAYTRTREELNQPNHRNGGGIEINRYYRHATTLFHVTTLLIPLSADYRVAIDFNMASVHTSVVAALAKCASLKSTIGARK